MAKNANGTENKANVAVADETLTETETVTAETEIDEGKTENAPSKLISGLALKREKYKADGKEYWGYFVEGNILGNTKKANFSAPKNDRGGFDLLDIIFEKKKSIDLALTPYVMRDEKTNKITQKGFTYEGYTIGSDGMPYSCSIKLRGASDKSLLEVFLRQVGIEV